MNLAARINLIKPSATLAITAKANALKAEGRDIIGFGAGEPDFDTPPHIKEAAIRAIHDGFTKYTPVGGTDELKDAIIAKLQRDNGINYRRGEVVVSCGAKHSIYNLAQVLFEEGDEVIIPSPYWVSYTDIVILAGAKPVIVETKASDGFKLHPDRLEEAITGRTKAVILNGPSNPTGTAYSAEELSRLADVIVRKGILVIADDIYEKILYDGFRFATIASVSEEVKNLTVVVNGVSKAYAMTGWRIGYAAGPEQIISAVNKLQSQNTSNPASIAQKASVEALNGPQDCVSAMVREFQKRRDVIVAALQAIPGISCFRPQGAFYVFPDFSSVYGRCYKGKPVRTSTELATYLLDEANIAVVPGIEFGHDDCVRLSYATSMKLIQAGVERISEAIRNLT